MSYKLDQVLVVDIESTCWEGEPPEGQSSEIIEVGLCVLNLKTLKRDNKVSILIQPETSEISDFCTELTTLTPDMFVHAGSLKSACQTLKKDYLSKTRTWASWGDYDRRQFERVCAKQNVGYPFGNTHLNIKNLYAMSKGLRQEVGLDIAYEQLGWEMMGVHHRGDDDAWNIAGILSYLLRRE